MLKEQKEQKEAFNTLATKVSQNSKELNDKFSNFLHETTSVAQNSKELNDTYSNFLHKT